MSRDIEHEQISGSTTEQLVRRLEEIRKGAIPLLSVNNLPVYMPKDLREMQRILSEIYCRETGIASEPHVIHVPPRFSVTPRDPQDVTLAILSEIFLNSPEFEASHNEFLNDLETKNDELLKRKPN